MRLHRRETSLLGVWKDQLGAVWTAGETAGEKMERDQREAPELPKDVLTVRVQ